MIKAITVVKDILTAKKLDLYGLVINAGVGESLPMEVLSRESMLRVFDGKSEMEVDDTHSQSMSLALSRRPTRLLGFCEPANLLKSVLW